MDTTTLLIILVVVLLLFGGGFTVAGVGGKCSARESSGAAVTYAGAFKNTG